MFTLSELIRAVAAYMERGHLRPLQDLGIEDWRDAGRVLRNNHITFEMKLVPLVIRLGNGNSIDEKNGRYRVWQRGGKLIHQGEELGAALYIAYKE